MSLDLMQYVFYLCMQKLKYCSDFSRTFTDKKIVHTYINIHELSKIKQNFKIKIKWKALYVVNLVCLIKIYWSFSSLFFGHRIGVLVESKSSKFPLKTNLWRLFIKIMVFCCVWFSTTKERYMDRTGGHIDRQKVLIRIIFKTWRDGGNGRNG